MAFNDILIGRNSNETEMLININSIIAKGNNIESCIIIHFTNDASLDDIDKALKVRSSDSEIECKFISYNNISQTDSGILILKVKDTYKMYSFIFNDSNQLFMNNVDTK